MSDSRSIVEAWLNIIATDYKSIIDSKGLTASGKTKEKTAVVMREDGGGIEVPLYNKALFQGRKPNINQSPEAIRHFVGWAGYYIFTPWAQQKGIAINPYAVAWSVATKGYEKKLSIDEIVTEQKKKDLLQSMGNNYVTELKQSINEIWQR